MVDNHHIAILTQMNMLASRFGLKPQDFLFVIQDNEEAAEFILYCDGPSGVGGVTAKKTRLNYDAMLKCLGIADSEEFAAKPEAFLDKLDDALRRAPRFRGRTE